MDIRTYPISFEAAPFSRSKSPFLKSRPSTGEDEPTKYWLSTLPKDVSFRRLVDTAKLRWRIERDYQALKQELALGYFEGRGWRGFRQDLVPPLCSRNLPYPTVANPEAPPLRPERPRRRIKAAIGQQRANVIFGPRLLGRD